METYYYSITVVKAESEEEAIERICDGEFIEAHELCDRVMTEEILRNYLIKKQTKMSTFKTHNDKEIEVNGTSLKGEIITDYKDLKRVFGKPLDGDSYKVDAEWNIEFEDGKVATIYNYKNGKNYNGKNGLPKSKITDWHIGGYSNDVVERVQNLLKSN